ncbi:MAG: hypothetical protein KDI64_21640, partial [Candidatus Accumulibacter sp.]|nr:hypothetical protein [Accumulibacter sp.]
MNDGLRQFVQRVRQACPDLTGADIADAIWLSRHLGAATPIGSAAPAAPLEEGGGTGMKHRPEGRPAPAPAPAGGRADGRRAAVSARSGKPGRARALVINAPAPPALDDEVALTRALRPLRRRLASRVRFHVDETATARRIAEEGVWEPVLRAAQDRWLSAAVVVDRARSMDVWSPRTKAFIRLLRHLGAFRAVTCWDWHTDRGGTLYHRRSQAMDALEVSPRRVIGAAGAQVTFVVSDCISSAWEQGTAAATLGTWTRHSHVILVQPLPEALWEQTRLVHAHRVDLASPAAGASNHRFAVHDAWAEFDLGLDDEVRDGDATALAVLPLEPEALARWARFAMGAHRGTLPGMRLGSGAEGGMAGAGEPDLSGGERLERFLAAASPGARRLARLLAASPHVCLPIVRMLRDRVDQGGAEIEAEVLLSGLLRAEAPAGAGTDPDSVAYHFVEGVRERLLGASDVQASREVLMLVSSYVEAHMGALHGFRAVVASPREHVGSFEAGDDDPMARNAAAILERLGGAYAEVLVRHDGGAEDTEPSVPEKMGEVLTSFAGSLKDDEAVQQDVEGQRPFAVLQVDLEEEGDGLRFQFQSVLGGVREDRLLHGGRELRQHAVEPDPGRFQHFITDLLPEEMLQRIQADPTHALLITCEIPAPWDFFPTGHDVARWVFSVPMRRNLPVGPRAAWAVTGATLAAWEWQTIEGLGCR